jgi:hypothetical protein
MPPSILALLSKSSATIIHVEACPVRPLGPFHLARIPRISSGTLKVRADLVDLLKKILNGRCGKELP